MGVDFLKKYSGFIIAVVLGIAIYNVSKTHKALDSLVIGIVSGILIKTFAKRHAFLFNGIELAQKIFIPLGIIFYGVNLKLDKLSEIPMISWGILLAMQAVIFLTALLLGKIFSMPKRFSVLIAVGTAICGASAIAITTPLVNAEPEETGASLIVITFFGFIGMLLCPLAITLLDFNKISYAFLCATALHMTGFVKIAAAAFGENCVKLALSIKMARTAMLIPALLFICLGMAKIDKTKRFSFFYSVPWFLLVFIIVGIMASSVHALDPVFEFMGLWAGIFFTIALTSIGLSVDFKNILDVGAAPIVVSLLSWTASLFTFFLLKGYIF